MVSKDEKESRLREILEFWAYVRARAGEHDEVSALSVHGEAVAWGMMAAALLAHGDESLRRGVCFAHRVRWCGRLVPFPAWPNLQPDKLDSMRCDLTRRRITENYDSCCRRNLASAEVLTMTCPLGSGAESVAVCAAVRSEAGVARAAGAKWLRRWRRRRHLRRVRLIRTGSPAVAPKGTRFLRARPRRLTPDSRYATCFRGSRHGTTC